MNLHQYHHSCNSYLQVLLKADRQDLSHGGSSALLLILLLLTNYGFFSQILAGQPGNGLLKVQMDRLEILY